MIESRNPHLVSRRKNKKIPGWLIPILFLGICVGAWLYFKANPVPVKAQVLDLIGVATTNIVTGSITQGISTTGAVRSNQSASLSWGASGQVAQVLVKVGDQVQKGQVLAQLDPESNQAWTTAHANLLMAQEALAALQDDTVAIATARIALLNAQAAVDSAQKTLDDLDIPATQAQIDAANATYLQDQKNVERLQVIYNVAVASEQDALTLARALESLNAAVLKENRDFAYLNSLKNNQPDSTAQAEANTSLFLAQAKLAVAQADYDAVKDGPSAADISVAQAKIDTIESSLDQQTIVAPFDGTISAVAVQENDLVSAGTYAFRIDDESGLYIDLPVSEVDVTGLAMGQPVTLAFDAVSGSHFEAQISSISSVGIVSGGTSNYTVTVRIIDPGPSVMPGMTASAEIITQEVNDILLVPNLSLATLDGAGVIYLITDGKATPVSVTAGLTSDTQTQITSPDIHAGDIIVVNPAALMARQSYGGIGPVLANLLQVLGVTTQS